MLVDGGISGHKMFEVWFMCVCGAWWLVAVIMRIRMHMCVGVVVQG
jgi:hypothetical protein